MYSYIWDSLFVRSEFQNIRSPLSFFGMGRSFAEGGGIDKTPELIMWPQHRPPSLS